ASGGWVCRGIAGGAAVKLLVSLAFLVPSELSTKIPPLPHAELAIELAPALLAVGFLLGVRQSAVIVAGALVSSLVLIPLIAWVGPGLQAPLFPETKKLVAQMSTAELWSRYVRYIGAGAVAVAGVLTVLRNLPSMAGAFAAVVRGLRRTSAPNGSSAAPSELTTIAQTNRDLPGPFVLGGILLVVAV